MYDKLLDELTASVKKAGELRRGEREPAREFDVSEEVKAIRKATRLSQAKFAKVINMQVRTLQNYEQGRRTPKGPTLALLRAIKKDPVHVLAALSE